MKKIQLKDAIASEDNSIKEVMCLIDNSGLRAAYIVNADNKLSGVVSDSEIRKAILKGRDVKSPVKNIINENPVILREDVLSSHEQTSKIVKRLRERMPDSRYILVVDKDNVPKNLILINDLWKETIRHPGVGIPAKKILIVGGAGYLGSVLTRKLLEKGFRVRVLDLLMYGSHPIDGLLSEDNFELIEGDMRNISTLVHSLEGIDAAISLAAIVGDPACKNKPEETVETNFLANKILAEACKYHQVNRFIYASTCSVYGAMHGMRNLTEGSALNPVSLYARSKIQSEEGIIALEDENFAPTILRMATLYGYSPRMRFDLMVNTMIKTAMLERKIFIHGGGLQWRPLLHVEDAADAYIKCLELPLHKVKGEVFNVGSSSQNFQILEIGKTVKKHIPEAELIVEKGNADPRNYFVSFAKISRRLAYQPNRQLGESVRRIRRAIQEGEIKDLNHPRYYNVEYNQ